MDEHQRPNGIPVTRFTLQSIYAQSDGEKLEFDYESGNTSILVSHYRATFIYIYFKCCIWSFFCLGWFSNTDFIPSGQSIHLSGWDSEAGKVQNLFFVGNMIILLV